jgi:hypothetical protein
LFGVNLRSRSVGGIFVAVAVCVFWASATVWGAKKDEEVMTRAPMPRDVAAMAYIGSTIEIPLVVSGRVVEPLKILIRSKPGMGRLGEVRILPGGRGGVITYTPFAEAQPGVDGFSFAAQSIDSPVSSPARVEIVLRLRPARIEHARKVDFGAVAVGGNRVLDLPLTNSGADTAVLEPRVKEPWAIETPVPFSLEGGRTESIRLRLKPSQAGEFFERVDLGGEWGGFSVRGSAFIPLEWSPDSLVFSSGERAAGRAAVELRNVSSERRVVEFNWPEILEGPREVAVEANGEAVVEVVLRAGPEFAAAGTVQFHSAGFSGILPYKVESAPAFLVFEPAEKLDLGEVAAGESATGKIVLRNTGGSPARVRLTPESGLQLGAEAAGFVIEPGGSHEIGVSFFLDEPGTFTRRVAVEGDAEPRLEFKVLARARAGRPVGELLNLPSTVKEEAVASGLPPVTDFTGARIEEEFLELEWKAPLAAAVGYVVEQRVLGRGNELESWVPAEGVKISAEQGKGRAMFYHLQPGTEVVVRIRALDAEGRAGAPSQRISLRIPTRDHGSGVWLFYTALTLVIFACGFWFVKKRVRFGGDDLDRRVANLERRG